VERTSFWRFPAQRLDFANTDARKSFLVGTNANKYAIEESAGTRMDVGENARDEENSVSITACRTAMEGKNVQKYPAR
jgi:hypothetical protein